MKKRYNRETYKNWLLENKDEIIKSQVEYVTHFYNTTLKKDFLKKHPEVSLEYVLESGDAYNFDYASHFYGKAKNCKEKVGNIELKDYLDLIRDEPFENIIYLFIKNGEVIDKKQFKGLRCEIPFIKGRDEEIISHAKELGADIYVIHNHPFEYYANPSKPDFHSGKELKRECKKNGIDLLDWGVVSNNDYYSYKQKGEI